MDIVDSHVHLFPAAAAADPGAWAARHGEPHFGRLAASPLQGWATADALVERMDAAGVAACWLLGWYWQNPATAAAENDRLLAAAARHPGRLLPFATVCPGAGARAVDAASAALAAGCRGFGEVLPPVQGFAWEDPAWHAMLEIAAAARAPVVVHVTEPVGPTYPGRVDTPLADMVACIRAHPQVRWVLAHWGGGLPFYLLNPQVRAHLAQVHFDSAASPLLYDTRVWRTVAALAGADRILFGSDFPLTCYPRRPNQPNFTDLLAEVRASGLSAGERAAALGGNARRLLE
jgi:hypothetical protein